MAPNQEVDDAKLARMLQELENEEARYANNNNNNNNLSVAIPSAPVYHEDDHDTPLTSPISSAGSSDEEFARSLQRQQEQHSSRRVGVVPPPVVRSDVDYARKVEQEMRDEEVARQLERAEQEAVNAHVAARNNNNNNRNNHRTTRRRPTWTLRRLCILFIPVAIAVGTALVLYIVFSGNANSIPFLGSREDDGFNGMEPGDLHQWPPSSNGKGLELTLWNALDATWQDAYTQAVDDWENGDPDVLTLSSVSVAYESACRPEAGIMKVCNGEYGDTGWRGVNSLTIQNGWITRSVAKLNDSYLKRAPYADRVYTACHEIGHGYGLPHTDENFGNEDLGNCMDYTNTPENNMQPDLSNFLLLADLYGTVNGVEYEPPPAENGGERQLLRHRHGQRDLSDVDACGTPEAVARYDEIMEAFHHDGGGPQESDDCKQVKDSEFGSLWKIHLGTNCEMEVHLLRAMSQD